MYHYKCHSLSVHQKNLEQAWVEVFSLEFLLPVDDCCYYPKHTLHRSQKQWEHRPFECYQGWHMFLNSLMPFDKPIKMRDLLHSSTFSSSHIVTTFSATLISPQRDSLPKTHIIHHCIISLLKLICFSTSYIFPSFFAFLFYFRSTQQRWKDTHPPAHTNQICEWDINSNYLGSQGIFQDIPLQINTELPHKENISHQTF